MGSTVLHDLSHPLRTGMPVYPGDPAVAVGQALTVDADGVNVLALHLGSQSGTHVDAPFHVDDALPDLDALPLERFVGPAVLLDVRDAAPRAELGERVLDPVAARLRPGVVLLVVTGWSRHWGTDDYLAHPWLSPELSQRVVDLGVRTVGIDALSVDVTPDGGATALPSHQVLCGAHVVIAENLTGLESLLDAQRDGSAVGVSLLPLRIEHGDGAPVRAVATVRSAERDREEQP
ncbi:MAG: cyclase family protein [Actinomycetota bacterium]